MYLSGDAPLPGEYRFMPLDELQRASCRADAGGACARRRRLREREPAGPGSGDPADRAARARHRPPPRQHALRRREPDRRRRVVDRRGAARRLPRARRRAHAGDRGGAVHRARHGHRPLPVHEHDAEGAAPRRGARRGRRRRAPDLPGRVRVACSSRSSSCSPARSSARRCTRAAASSSRTCCATTSREVVGGRAVLRGDHRLPPRRRGRGHGRADPRAAARRTGRPARQPALERRRARRVRDRAQVGRRRPPPGGRVLERARIEEITDFVRREFSRCGSTADGDGDGGPPAAPTAAPASSRRPFPRALEPTGIVLVDKPAGPSSFAIVAQLRRRTGARTGHAGTLDPFATGLLVLLSGRATRLAPCFVGLDKRYVTEIDLTARTATGDVDGRGRGRARAAGTRRNSSGGSRRLRGEVELPIPAASAVKIGGERAYRLAAARRGGRACRAPLARPRARRHRVYEGDVRLDLRVSSGTYVRAIADALGGHCRDAAPAGGRAVPRRGGRSGAHHPRRSLADCR